MNRFVFRHEAERELAREAAYYAGRREGGGERFVAAIEAALERAVRQPLGGAPFFAGTRRILVKGFPFSVVYRSKDEELLIVAIVPHRRHPMYWVDCEGK